jgi:hypothetical protein
MLCLIPASQTKPPGSLSLPVLIYELRCKLHTKPGDPPTIWAPIISLELSTLEMYSIYTTRQVGNTGRVPARCDEVQYCCYHLCNCRLPVPIQYNLAAHLELSSGVHRAAPRQYNAYCTDTPQHAAQQTNPPGAQAARTNPRHKACVVHRPARLRGIAIPKNSACGLKIY